MNSRYQDLVKQLFKKYPRLFKCPNKILGHTDAIIHNILYDEPKCIYILLYKTNSVEQDEMIVEILKMDRDLSGFNLPIILPFTPCCVDNFIAESESQRSQPAPANQTPQSEHSDSNKFHPANQTCLDKQKFHSAD